ncbi:peroxidase 29-like [Asparagus officinalis]|uniref:peroxidase 29-like n=1 Tax=Asparagus officinalis TaxID=4686 RepID=UPI00098E1C15|nr:peroxidase 29-like [Asparagus officinalis]
MAAGYNIPRSLQLHSVQCAACILLLITAIGIGEGSELATDYYKYSCPGLEAIVKDSLLPIFFTDPRSPAGFLRLLFHDCQVQGCDASILLETDYNKGITSELLSSRNFGIRNIDSIAKIKSIVEEFCPGQVSCADIIALAAREAVAYSGGPKIVIPLGRKDSTMGSNLRADDELPSASTGVDDAVRIFMGREMSIEETVALLGAHTLGVGHCISIAHRLYNSNVNHRERIDSVFEAYLRLNCPTEVPITNYTFIVSDLTSLIFDNQYYRDVMSGRGLFSIDSDMSMDPRTVPIVRRFAEDQAYFFQVFSSAFVKLSSAVNPEGGEIRRECRRIN